LLDPLRKWVLRRFRSRAQIGMCLAHLGVGVFILGATMVFRYTVETDVAARTGDRFEVGGYEILFRSVRPVEGPTFGRGGRASCARMARS
jgi:cytochrome c-type biogenesis protein CcmF